ncbi:MAG: hypothetical protein LH609_06540 [Rudanella sp.]|nr:hypothetical protein [Rudanella sp.]
MADQLPHPQQTDPLGLKTFALSESAYDLTCSLRGIYGRLCHAERQEFDVDQTLINSWQNRSKEIGRAYRRLGGKSLPEIGEFITSITTEWRELTALETERTLAPAHVH